MKRFGLIGSPIAHSLSPAMFRAAYPEWEYDLIETRDFEEAWQIFRRNYTAVNVTAPFKLQAFERADEADTVTRQIGAANILLNQETGVKALNTDFWAVCQLLRLNMPPLETPKALVVGCGGAGRAAALACTNLHLETAVANRDFDKAERYCSHAGGMEPLTLEEAERRLPQFGIVIYTLPLEIPLARMIREREEMIALEANYLNPCLSGPNYISGKQWLVAQAAAGFRVMTGRIPDWERLNTIL